MKLKTTEQEKRLCRHMAKDMTVFTSLLDDLDTLESQVRTLEEALRDARPSVENESDSFSEEGLASLQLLAEIDAALETKGEK